MTADELEKWLEDPKSTKAGTGVGIESGHRIVEILRKNPDRDPEKYDDEDVEHMRKVVSYAKRHLAQEGHLKDTKTRGELENTKSTISLKNWGHDPVKTLDEEDRQEETEDRPDTDGSSTPEDSERAHKRSTQKDSGSSAGVAQTTGNKRKLDADEQDRPETEETGNVRGEHIQEDSEDDVDNPQELEERVDDEKLEDGEDDRPRKKSKVAGDA